ncbi:MAG: sugar phosphate isomerase/epimerase [Rhodospirillaceae bacterium]|nr:MAG: sugar phosphate isomerase/epimerase [Rhodospirillaceae bacterium]
MMKASLPELIEIAARHGFRRITARPLAFAAALEAGFTEKALRRRLADASIQVTMIDGLTRGLPGVPPVETIDPATRAALPADALNPADEETCFRAAEALEAGVVNLIHYRGQRLPLEEMAEAVGKICRRASARGLQMALEFVAGTGLPNLPFAQAVTEACGEPNCALTLDFCHLDRSGGTVEDVRRLPPGAIANIQISDHMPQPPGSVYVPMSGRLMPGEGMLPLRELMEAALANSPNATADIEVLNAELRDLPMDEVAARMAAALQTWRATL